MMTTMFGGALAGAWAEAIPVNAVASRSPLATLPNARVNLDLVVMVKPPGILLI
jgi:hypothetical protein